MKHQIDLISGDRHCDGHGVSETCTIESNLSPAEIEGAYKLGSEIVGFDLINNVCVNYEDDIINVEYIIKLISLGCNAFEHFGKIGANTSVTLDLEQFINIFLFIVVLGNKDFEFKIIKSKSIEIGGYGLFF